MLTQAMQAHLVVVFAIVLVTTTALVQSGTVDPLAVPDTAPKKDPPPSFVKNAAAAAAKRCPGFLSCLIGSPKKKPWHYTAAEKLALLDNWQTKVDAILSSEPGRLKRLLSQQRKKREYFEQFQVLLRKTRAELKNPGSVHKDYFWEQCLKYAKKIDRWWYSRSGYSKLAIAVAGVLGYALHDPIRGFLQSEPISPEPIPDYPAVEQLPPKEETEVLTPRVPRPKSGLGGLWIGIIITIAVVVTFGLAAVGLWFVRGVLRSDPAEKAATEDQKKSGGGTSELKKKRASRSKTSSGKTTTAGKV